MGMEKTQRAVNRNLAVETDTAWAGLMEQFYDLEQQLGWVKDTIFGMAGAEKVWKARSRYAWFLAGQPADFDTCWQRVCAEVQRRLGDSDYANLSVGRGQLGGARRALATYDDLTGKIEVVHAGVAALAKVFADAGTWSRFFIVRNNNGHIHSSMGCRTCRVTTRFGWLPDLSGLTEAEAVAEHGAILCSVCFPSAPIEWTMSTYGAEKKREK